jgi:L-methionine (R)-S-oxide reductase
MTMDTESLSDDIHRETLLAAKGLIKDESDFIAVLANIAALLHHNLKQHWTGFYRVVGRQLILGPFQGPVACTEIQYNQGVCGKAWAAAKTLIVDDVHKFDGHIACSPYSNSEIVVPLIINSMVVAVLDIDSTSFAAFASSEQRLLEQICSEIGSGKYQSGL